jgi:cytochrome c553
MTQTSQYKGLYNRSQSYGLTPLLLRSVTMKKTLLKIAAPIVVAVCGLVSPLPSAAQPQGDVAAGQKKAAMCIGCHGIVGYQASFPEVHKVPMISGQNAPYIANALASYKKGDRKHPTMRGIAGSLSEQDMLDLAAFYEQHGTITSTPTAPAVAQPEANAQVVALLKKGECMTCHGASFSKGKDSTYPKLAGQYADYLYVALKSYQISGSPHLGRNNAVMPGQIKGFTHAELKALAAYLASLSGELKVVPQSPFR